LRDENFLGRTATMPASMCYNVMLIKFMHVSGAIFVGLFVVASARAQQPAGGAAAPSSGPMGVKGPASQKTEPCWEQAGISKSALEQSRSTRESARSQIQSVCSETNLTEQQKREKIRQIRQTAQQRVNAMISPAERQKLEACRRGNHTGGHPAAGDPCAGLGR